MLTRSKQWPTTIAIATATTTATVTAAATAKTSSTVGKELS